MFTRIKEYFVLALCSLIVSCDKQAQETFVLSDYSIDYKVINGIIDERAEDIFPSLDIIISGPQLREWTVVLENEKQQYSFTVMTGEENIVEIPKYLSPMEPGKYEFDMKVTDSKTDYILRRTQLAVLVNKIEYPDIEGVRITDIYLITNNQSKERVDESVVLNLKKGDSGLFVVDIDPYSDDLELAVETQGGNSINLEKSSKENLSFLVPFVINDIGALSVNFVLRLNEKLCYSCLIQINISNSSPVDPGEPEEKTVSLSVPAVIFADKEAVAVAMFSGINEGNAISLSFLIDGLIKYSSEVVFNGMPVMLPLAGEMIAQRGWHKFQLKASVKDTSEEIESEIVSCCVSQPTFRWTTIDGSTCNYGLKYHSASNRMLLVANMDCDKEAIRKISLRDNATGNSFSLLDDDSFIFVVGHLQRGERTFTVTAEAESRTYTWSLDTKMYDEWTWTPYINGNKLYARLSGPISTLPCNVRLNLKLTLSAYIPYKEAVIRNGERVEDPKGQYVDIGIVQEERSFSAGTGNGNKELWSGDISRGISYGKKKAAEVSVTKNGSSRWVYENGTWNKQYYTPTPIPQIDIFISGTVYDEMDYKYVSFRIDYDTLESWMSSQGYGFRGREYFEWD